MIGDDEETARLERFKQLTIHGGAIDGRYVHYVMVVEEERYEIEIANVCWRGIIKLAQQDDGALHGRRLKTGLKILFCPPAKVGCVLRVDHSAGSDCARHQLGAVTTARAHIESFHPGL